MSVLALVAIAGAEDLDLRAGRLQLSEDAVVASGEVVLLYAGGRLQAESLELDLELERLVLGQVRASPCGCETPPWTVRAREAEVDLASESLRLRSASFWLGPVPLLWLPRWRQGMGEERAWAGLPELGQNGAGRWLGLPLNLQTGDLLLQAVPELYLEPLDLRLRGSARGDFGWLDLALQPQHEQGAASGDLAVTASGFLLAWRGDWISDLDQQQLYGDAWLDRSLPWVRQASLLETPWGASLEVFGSQEGGEAVTPLVSLPWSHELERFEIEARADAWEGHQRLEAGLRVDERLDLGPGELELEAGTRSYLVGLARPSVDVAARAELGLPLWSQGPRARWELVPSVELGAGQRLMTGVASGHVPVPRAEDPLIGSWLEQAGLFTDQAPEAVFAGPQLELRRWGEGRLELGVQAPWSLDGPGLGAHLGGRRGRWELRTQGSWTEQAWLGLGSLGFRGESLRAGLTLLGTEELLQARSELGLELQGRRGAWTPGLGAVAEPGQLDEVSGSLGYAAGCGCLAVGARVALAEDRELPYGGLWVDLRP